jgi:acetyl esterase/lipase
MKARNMKQTLIILIPIVLAMMSNVNAQNTTIVLWPDGAPGAVGKLPEDIPAITAYPAPKDKATGAAVVVFPGGGYSHLSEIKEGSDVAVMFNKLGITAFVLKYRLGMRYHQPAPLLDGARAVRTVRSRAKEWNIDPVKIGILGFSAGGHLAATLATHFDAGKADAADFIDRVSSRPDLVMLIYPVITMGEFTHAGSKKNLLGENPSAELVKLYSNELQVAKDTPPTFLVHTTTDPAVPVENSMLFAEALRKAKVPFEMHIYEQGPHGFGMAPADPYLNSWVDRCADWLRVHGFIPKK